MCRPAHGGAHSGSHIQCEFRAIDGVLRRTLFGAVGLKGATGFIGAGAPACIGVPRKGFPGGTDGVVEEIN